MQSHCRRVQSHCRRVRSHCRSFFGSIGIETVEQPLDGRLRLAKSAVDLAFDPVAFKHTKHILRAAEFLRDLVARRVVTLQHVKGAVMLADVLTKACARPIFLELIRLLDGYAASGQVIVS